jgi:purine-binding chemotaxis protein CheW
MAISGISELKTYLSFSLEGEDYAVDVANVREVIDDTKITRVPRTPDFMKGVINLRGGVVPVIDMRMKFGLPVTEATVDTCIIVLEVESDGEASFIGALVDAVRAVFEMSPDEIEETPSLGMRADTEFILGMGKQGDRFIMILDVDTVFSTSELVSINTPGNEINLEGDVGEIDDLSQSSVEESVNDEHGVALAMD